jgi:uncharacterized protein YukE
MDIYEVKERELNELKSDFSRIKQETNSSVEKLQHFIKSSEEEKNNQQNITHEKLLSFEMALNEIRNQLKELKDGFNKEGEELRGEMKILGNKIKCNRDVNKLASYVNIFREKLIERLARDKDIHRKFKKNEWNKMIVYLKIEKQMSKLYECMAHYSINKQVWTNLKRFYNELNHQDRIEKMTHENAMNIIGNLKSTDYEKYANDLKLLVQVFKDNNWRKCCLKLVLIKI